MLITEWRWQLCLILYYRSLGRRPSPSAHPHITTTTTSNSSRCHRLQDGCSRTDSRPPPTPATGARRTRQPPANAVRRRHGRPGLPRTSRRRRPRGSRRRSATTWNQPTVGRPSRCDWPPTRREPPAARPPPPGGSKPVDPTRSVVAPLPTSFWRVWYRRFTRRRRTTKTGGTSHSWSQPVTAQPSRAATRQRLGLPLCLSSATPAEQLSKNQKNASYCEISVC